MNEPQYLTIKEAAHHADVHINTVSRWLREGRLTRHTIRGRFVRIDAAELQRLLTPTAVRP